MIPDSATIARRRHMVTMITRSIIAIFAAWILWGTTAAIGAVLQAILAGPMDYLIPSVVGLFSLHVPLLLLVVAMVFVEQRLVRWIVPLPRPETACPTCGYSLKDLKSPICPECGTNLRP